MKNPEQIINNNEKLTDIADRLDKLQQIENKGNGVSCVKSVITYLRLGDIESAKQICQTDHDKIRNYPALVEFIKNNLFKEGEEHPWSVLERL